MVIESIVPIVRAVSITVSAIGILIILYGVLLSLFELLRIEFGRLKGRNPCELRELLRHHLGSYLLLGLEMLVAADIIHTILHPTLRELAVLGSIIAIRTVLNIFLNKELRDGHKCNVPV